MIAKSTGSRYPYQTLLGGTVPTIYVEESTPVLLAHTIEFHSPGRIVGMRYYRGLGSIGGQLAMVKASRLADQIERVALFHDRNAVDGPEEGEWQNTYFKSMLRVEADTFRTIMVYFRHGLYWRTPNVFDIDLVTGDLEGHADAEGAPNGSFDYFPQWYPETSYQASAYGIDVLFLADHQLVELP